MNRLDPQVVDRLIKLLGMLGSAHDGEIANAGRLAHALVHQRGLTWADIIAPPLAPQPLGWRDKVRCCLEHQHLLNAKERQFIGSLLMWRGVPTDRQLAWLDRIFQGLPR
jgi:hypothetical protein